MEKKRENGTHTHTHIHIRGVNQTEPYWLMVFRPKRLMSCPDIPSLILPVCLLMCCKWSSSFFSVSSLAVLFCSPQTRACLPQAAHVSKRVMLNSRRFARSYAGTRQQQRAKNGTNDKINVKIKEIQVKFRNGTDRRSFFTLNAVPFSFFLVLMASK